MDMQVKDSPGLCRCCFSEGCYKDLSTAYAWMGDTEIYAEMLLECFDISITQHVDGPNGPNRLICEVCITRLRDASNFKKQVLDCEKKFIDMVAKGSFKASTSEFSVQVSVEKEPKLEPILEEDIEAPSLDYLDDLDYDDDFDPKGEASTSHQSDDNEPLAKLTTRKRKLKPKKETATKVEKKAKTSKVVKKEEKPKATKKETVQSVKWTIVRRRNIQILFNNTTLIPFKWRGRYRCFFCSQDFTRPDLLRSHHNLTHKNCTLEDHAIKNLKGGYNLEIKLDISEPICLVCNETISRLDDIIDHLNSKHDLGYDNTLDILYEEYRLNDLSCISCEEKFKYFGALVSHMNNVHPKNCYKCEKCNNNFNKKRDLFSHMKNYHREGGYTCDFCSHNFPTLNMLSKHRNNVHLTRCEICFLKLPSAALKNKHMKVEHPGENGIFKCGKCSKVLQTTQGLRQHVRKCMPENNYPIEDHPEFDNVEEFEDTAGLKRQSVQHLKSNLITLINMTTIIPFNFFKNKFNCFQCTEDFACSDDLRVHTAGAHTTVCDLTSKCIKKIRESKMTVKIDISTTACKICCMTMTDFSSLLDHLNEKHNANYDKELVNIQAYRLIRDYMECPYCPGEVFRFFGTLLKHVNSKHTFNNLICVHCGQTFRKEQNLRIHIWRHHTEGQFKCTICGVECLMPSRLHMHMAKVHGVKSAKCSMCGEKFSTQYLRQKHLIEVHNSGHKCSYCGKLFVRNSFMKDHIRRTHLKEKNVECSACGMKFFNNILLRRHMVKHSGRKNFHCDVCGERFFWRKGLVRHMVRHNKQATMHTMISL